jgi:uncharacterized protein YegL
MALTDYVEIPGRTMVGLFIVETSGRMKGHKIGAVNAAIRELLPEIKDLSNEYADVQIKIAALEFSSGAKWLTPNGPVEADKFNWTNLDAEGNADLGAAFKALNEKLSLNAFMADVTGFCGSTIFLFSDGKPTDDWQKELDKLKQNNWFKAAVKVAFPVGADADRDILKSFTGTKELVFEDFNPATLIKLFRVIDDLPASPVYD